MKFKKIVESKKEIKNQKDLVDNMDLEDVKSMEEKGEEEHKENVKVFKDALKQCSLVEGYNYTIDKNNLYTVNIKDRKQLAKLVENLKQNKIKHRISRSKLEGYKYDVMFKNTLAESLKEYWDDEPGDNFGYNKYPNLTFKYEVHAVDDKDEDKVYKEFANKQQAIKYAKNNKIKCFIDEVTYSKNGDFIQSDTIYGPNDLGESQEKTEVKKITTPRGTFEVVDKTEDELRKDGYGYHHSGNGYKIFVKNNQAVAIKECNLREDTINQTTKEIIKQKGNNTPITDEDQKKEFEAEDANNWNESLDKNNLKNEILDCCKKFYTEVLNWDDEDVTDMMTVTDIEVQDYKDIYEQPCTRVVLGTGYLTRRTLEKLCKYVEDNVLSKYDKNSYFEGEDPTSYSAIIRNEKDLKESSLSNSRLKKGDKVKLNPEWNDKIKDKSLLDDEYEVIGFWNNEKVVDIDDAPDEFIDLSGIRIKNTRTGKEYSVNRYQLDSINESLKEGYYDNEIELTRDGEQDNEYVIIEGTRDGYGIDQVEDSTITVRDLINYLSDYDDNTKVIIGNDWQRGYYYTYGSITDDSIKKVTIVDSEKEEDNEYDESLKLTEDPIQDRLEELKQISRQRQLTDDEVKELAELSRKKHESCKTIKGKKLTEGEFGEDLELNEQETQELLDNGAIDIARYLGSVEIHVEERPYEEGKYDIYIINPYDEVKLSANESLKEEKKTRKQPKWRYNGNAEKSAEFIANGTNLAGQPCCESDKDRFKYNPDKETIEWENDKYFVTVDDDVDDPEYSIFRKSDNKYISAFDNLDDCIRVIKNNYIRESEEDENTPLIDKDDKRPYTNRRRDALRKIKQKRPLTDDEYEELAYCDNEVSSRDAETRYLNGESLKESDEEDEVIEDDNIEEISLDDIDIDDIDVDNLDNISVDDIVDEDEEALDILKDKLDIEIIEEDDDESPILSIKPKEFETKKAPELKVEVEKEEADKINNTFNKEEEKVEEPEEIKDNKEDSNLPAVADDEDDIDFDEITDAEPIDAKKALASLKGVSLVDKPEEKDNNKSEDEEEFVDVEDDDIDDTSFLDKIA